MNNTDVLNFIDAKVGRMVVREGMLKIQPQRLTIPKTMKREAATLDI
jgi:hypothetical protein